MRIEIGFILSPRMGFPNAFHSGATTRFDFKLCVLLRQTVQALKQYRSLKRSSYYEVSFKRPDFQDSFLRHLLQPTNPYTP